MHLFVLCQHLPIKWTYFIDLWWILKIKNKINKQVFGMHNWDKLTGPLPAISTAPKLLRKPCSPQTQPAKKKLNEYRMIQKLSCDYKYLVYNRRLYWRMKTSSMPWSCIFWIEYRIFGHYCVIYHRWNTFKVCSYFETKLITMRLKETRSQITRFEWMK